MEFRHWVLRILQCKTIADFKHTLSEFQQAGNWSLLERSALSTVYAPRLMKLLASTDAEEKKFIVEDMAALCWGKSS
jgi:hypothetical protein